MTAALFAAGLLGAASSWAQMPGGAEGMGPMHGFERLHKELRLNPQQEELWKKAQGLQREAFRSMRARAEETRAKLRVEIYDTLDSGQKEKVRVAIRDGMDRMSQMGRRHRGGPRGEMHG
ncbi:MAG: hypothetical protein E6H59_10565 [Betaproteobacteria bacterium]|nr:MAG: hypothetical protein E6H59_10565 [Betaproteobacteria bacterium]